MEKKRILIVEDEKNIRELMARILESRHYEVDVADNGVSALSYLDKRPYDLVITDYMMPIIDGLELTIKIREKFPSTVVIIVTADGPVHDLLRNGANACIRKPFHIFEVQDMVRIILEKKEKTVAR